MEIVHDLIKAGNLHGALDNIARISELSFEVNFTRIFLDFHANANPQIESLAALIQTTSDPTQLADANLLVYDMLSLSRNWNHPLLNETVNSLVRLEQQMSKDQLVNWTRRKATYFRKIGRLNDAVSLYLQILRAFYGTNVLINVNTGARQDGVLPDTVAHVHYELARIQTQLSKYNEALQSLESGLRLDIAASNRVALLVRVVNLLEKLGKPSAAEAKRTELYGMLNLESPKACKVCSEEDGATKLVVPCCKSFIHADCLLKNFITSIPPGKNTALLKCPCCEITCEFIDAYNNLPELRTKIESSS
jgi:tetratricopeptide (TPR) repeat protein